MASYEWITEQDRSHSKNFPEESFLWSENITLDLEFEDKKEERKFSRQVFNLFIEDFCMKQRVPLKKLIHRLEKTILIRTLSRFNGSQKSAAEFFLQAGHQGFNRGLIGRCNHRFSKTGNTLILRYQ